MVNKRSRRSGSDSGAILIQTAITIMVLTALSAFVLDFGVMWLARRQAQNAADAGALAAGNALIYDSYGDRADTGPAHLSGVTTAGANQVFSQAPGVVVNQSLDGLGWVPNSPQTCKDAPGSCAQASVFRDGTNSSALLPTYFAQIFGQTTQKVRATATVQLRSANAATCMKPWMAPDKSDVSSYTLADVGLLLPLRYSAGTSHYHQADLNKSGAASNCPNGGGACYGYAITGCVGKDSDGTFQIGDSIEEKRGATTGQQKAIDVYNEDPSATWNASTKSVDNSCARNLSCNCSPANGGSGCANGLDGRISPRILAVALFRPSDLNALGGGNKTADITNFAGIFMLQPGTGPDPICTASTDNVCGYLMPSPGVINSGGTPAQGGSLNVFLSLIR